MGVFAVPRFRIQDALGNAIVGGHIHFYEPGTTTPKNTYSDAALTTPNANPVVSGSDGWTPEIWMSTDDYKVVIEDASGVTLKTYDPFYPVKSDVDGLVSGSSSSSTAAVTGTNTSTGAGVKGVNSGTGPGVWAEADTSSPASAALHLVPQDSFASSPTKGDVVSNSVSGLLSTYDGAEEARVVHNVARALTASAVNDSGTFTESYTIPANTLRVGSVIRVSVGVLCTAESGGPTVSTSVLIGSTVVSTGSFVTASTSSRWKHLCEILIKSIGSTGSFSSSGYCSYTSTAATIGTTTINTTIANAITVTVTRSGGTSCTTRCDIFIVDIS